MMTGSGLLTTLTETTSFANRAGFLIIVGLSCGMTVSTQTPTAQAAVLGRDRAVTTSTVSFFGMLGRLCASAAGQTILNNNAGSDIGPAVANALAAYAAALGVPVPALFDPTNGAGLTPQQLAQIPQVVAWGKQHGFAQAIAPVFWLGLAGGALLMCGAVWCQHIPLTAGAKPPAAASAAAPATAIDDAAAAAALKAVADSDEASKLGKSAAASAAATAESPEPAALAAASSEDPVAAAV